MAAGLLESDWMFSSHGIRPWHGIGSVIEDAPTSEDAIKIAKLDWKVTLEPVYLNGSIEIPNTFATVRSDTKAALGIVGKKYTPVQNVDAFKFIDEIMAQNETPVRYETAGSLFNGKKVFMLVRLPDYSLVGDKCEQYLFFSNSHDGSSAITAGVTNVRVVCNNTLQMAESTAKRTWTCRHVKGALESKLEALRALNLATDYSKAAEKEAADLVDKKISDFQSSEMFRYILGIKDSITPIQQNAITRISEIYKNKEDLQNLRGTAWGWYNAIADYTSNTVGTKNSAATRNNKVNRFLNGEPILHKAEAFLLAA